MKKRDRYEILSEVWLAAAVVSPNALSFVVAAVVALIHVLLLASCKEDV